MEFLDPQETVDCGTRGLREDIPGSNGQNSSAHQLVRGRKIVVSIVQPSSCLIFCAAHICHPFSQLCKKAAIIIILQVKELRLR